MKKVTKTPNDLLKENSSTDKKTLKENLSGNETLYVSTLSPAESISAWATRVNTLSPAVSISAGAELGSLKVNSVSQADSISPLASNFGTDTISPAPANISEATGMALSEPNSALSRSLDQLLTNNILSKKQVLSMTARELHDLKVHLASELATSEEVISALTKKAESFLRAKESKK